MLSNAFDAARTTAIRAFASAGLLAAVLVPGAARAADLDLYTAAPVTEGVPCDSPVSSSFPSVWLGHFTGGYSQYSGPGGTILLDWHDEKLCFPSRRTCDRWIASMRRDFHHPEGYYTCLTIR